MRVDVEVVAEYRAPKEGQTLEECEDRYAVSVSGPALDIVAVSDGASMAAQPGLWAQYLVARFIEAPTLAIDIAWLAPAARSFVAAFDLARLPWHALEKISRGAFATLAGLIVNRDAAEFSMVAVGDSCIAWWGTQDEGVFPYTSAEAMPEHPYLICHIADRNGNLPEHLQFRDSLPLGRGEQFFFLMTDALARWYLAARQQDSTPWETLLRATSSGEFESWLDTERGEGRIDNDDVTLVILRIQVEQKPVNDASSVTV